MEFPFNEPENVAVFTCRHILENHTDICRVTHDADDGAWQFLCGQKHEVADARIVSLKEIFVKDPSVGILADLPLGCVAIRENKESLWMRYVVTTQSTKR